MRTAKQNATRYGYAGSAAAFATAAAMRLPFLKDLPPEISVPIVLAAIHFLTELVKSKFKLNMTSTEK